MMFTLLSLFMAFTFVAGCNHCHFDTEQCKEQYKELYNELHKKLYQELQKELCDKEHYDNELQAIKAKIGPVVSFFAQYSDYRHSNIQENTVLLFDNAISNIGGGYNATTGQFTAPVSGTYIFSLNTLSDSSIWFNICIMHNGQCIALTQLTDASTLVVILELQKGDTVYAYKRDGPGNTMYGINHSTFSGVLVRAH